MDLTTSTLYPLFSNVAMMASIISLEYPAGIIITAAQIKIRSSGYEVKSYDTMQQCHPAKVKKDVELTRSLLHCPFVQYEKVSKYFSYCTSCKLFSEASVMSLLD